MKFIDVAITRARTTLNIFAMILIAGTLSYSSIPLEANPDVNIPVITIAVPHEGISPEDGERLLVKPMEIELKSLEGVDEISSHAGEGVVSLAVQFDFDYDPDNALIEVLRPASPRDDGRGDKLATRLPEPKPRRLATLRVGPPGFEPGT